MTDEFYAELRNIIAKPTPMTKIDTNNYPVWFTPALRQSLEEKLKYHRRFKKYKNPRDYDTFSMLRNRCKKLIKNDYKNFVSSVESSLDDDIKFFWRFVNDKKNNANSIPKTMKYGNHISSDEKEICEFFSNYFSSVFANPEETIFYSHNELSNRSNCTLSDNTITPDHIQQKIAKLD
ncbi:unnamed protein product [Parnassius apollo]|uniref:(apollo) hypothetical protein n=1 Tax=Parnassius apollo TaxID=110799 RepID=A0A8S3XZ89_PARAO|nr:unnamed protein product [Parnassius apollo]